MRVIKRGDWPKYQKKCSQCESLLEFGPSDTILIQDQDEKIPAIKCPVCSRQIYLDDEVVLAFRRAG